MVGRKGVYKIRDAHTKEKRNDTPQGDCYGRGGLEDEKKKEGRVKKKSQGVWGGYF